VQLQRLAAYRSALDELKAQNRVYPCTCTRTDILAAASAPHAADMGGPVYPGTCAHRTPSDAVHLDRPYAWRFRAAEPPAYTDSYQGETCVASGLAGGDFVVWRNDDMPAYQLAVVVDDAAQGITEVVRGDDLVPSTPRQLMLYAALGLTPPRFAHVPLVVGTDGKRLAKRHGDTRLSQLRDSGVSPEAVVGLLAWSCGWQADSRPITPRELLAVFDLAAIPREPFVLTAERVNGLNR
jgi:glutamyl-tRNA synthetase